jgi:hypothetical protein
MVQTHHMNIQDSLLHIFVVVYNIYFSQFFKCACRLNVIFVILLFRKANLLYHLNKFIVQL